MLRSTHNVIQTDCTALTIATQAGHVDVVDLLLERGANLNVQEKVMFMMLLLLIEHQKHPL
jgi:ankyrin repeat protein